MPAEPTLAFGDLEEQARLLMGIFSRAGYELVAPAILQPAGVFLDVVGEDLRARTYVFSDPHGQELCLRPDLTVPTCLLYLQRHPAADTPARYAYNGACFRFQPAGVTASRPREFRQAGIECFGAADPGASDAETAALTVSAVRAAGLGRFSLRIGDLGLFEALLDALEMPARWRARLLHHFWRPEAFLRELKRLTAGPIAPPRGVPAALLERIGTLGPLDAEAAVGAHLSSQGLELQGSRTLAEITHHLLERAKDARARPLGIEAARAIEGYIKIRCAPREGAALLAAFARDHGLTLDAAIAAFERRTQLLERAGVDMATTEFSTEFGRSLEYYTGFVFQIEAPELGRGINVAGGGRYDRLLQAVGAPRPVAAVGASIHTERLLTILGRGGPR